MTRTKKILILCVCALVLTGAYFGITKWSEKVTKEDENAFYMTDINSEDITAISWEYNGEVYRLEIESDEDGNEKWVNADDSDFEVNQDYAKSMANIICNIAASRIIKNTEDYSQYGLYEDETGIKIQMSDGSEFEILTGNYNEVSYEYYAMLKGEKDVFMVEGTYMDSFECTMEDLKAAEEEDYAEDDSATE